MRDVNTLYIYEDNIMGLTVSENAKRKTAVNTVTVSVPAAVKSPESSKPNSVYENQSSAKTSSKEGLQVERNGKNSKKTLNNENYVLQKLDNILHNKLEQKAGEEEKIQLLQAVTGLNYNEILKSDKTKIDKILKYISYALNKTNSKKTNLTELGIIANSYYVAVEFGQWSSIEQYERAQRRNSESLSQRLKRTGQNLDEYMRSQFGADRNLLGKGSDFVKARKAGISVEEYRAKRAMQDLSKMLTNSSKEEKFALVGAMKHLSQSENIDKNNRVNFYKMIYASLSQTEQIEFADMYANDKEILRMVGADANRSTIQGVTHETAKHTSEEGAIRLNRSIHDSATTIEARIAELEGKSNRTPEENAELANLKNQLNNQYTAMMIGDTTGSEANVNIVTEGVLEEIIQNNTSHSNRDQVMQGVAEYTVSHTEEMVHSPEEFSSIMNSVTNGDYEKYETQARADYNHSNQNQQDNKTKHNAETVSGNTEEINNLNIPASENLNITTSVNSNIETARTSEYSSNPFTDTHSNNSENSAAPAKTETPNISSSDGNKKSTVSRIRTDLKEERKGSVKWQQAINDYKRSGSDVQLKVLTSGLDVSTFKELVKNSSISTLQKFIESGEKGPDYESTEVLKEELEELKKKEGIEN